MSLRHKNSTYYEGNNEYRGLGIIRYCVLCEAHRPIQGGSVRVVFGGRHFCCVDHPRIKDIKCQPAPQKSQPDTPLKSLNVTTPTTSGYMKTKTPTPQRKIPNTAPIAPAPEKADMKVPVAGVAEDQVPNAMSAMMIILSRTNKKVRK